MTAWICRQIPSAQSGVSHTKVQVLPSTHCVPAKADPKYPTPERPCKTWARRIRPNSPPENCPGSEKGVAIGDGKLVYPNQDHGATVYNIGGRVRTKHTLHLYHSSRQESHSTTEKVDDNAGDFSSRAIDKHDSADEGDPPTSCLCLPGLRLRRWRRRRRAKVTPFNLPPSSTKATIALAIGGDNTHVHPPTTEMSVYDLDDVKGQERTGLGLPTRQMMKEDFDKWRERRKNDEIHIGCEKDEIGISRESILLPPRPKTSRGIGDIRGQQGESSLVKAEQSNAELNVWTTHHDRVKQADSLNLETEDTEEKDSNELLYYWTNLNEDCDEGGACVTSSEDAVVPGQRDIFAFSDNQQGDSGASLKSSEEDLPPSRPNTSQGIRRENGRGDSSSVMRGKQSATEVMTRVNNRVEDEQAASEHFIHQKAQSLKSGMKNKNSSSLDETQGSGEVLNILGNFDETDLKDEDKGQADDSREEYRYEKRVEEDIAAEQNAVSLSLSEEKIEVITSKSSKESIGAAGVLMTSEEERQYERQQRHQWQLAAIGEWATKYQDYGEDDYLSECYLRMDEFQKEQAIMKEWKTISDRYHSVGVIQDLQNMQALCKCTINQIERALRQFARICRGPVPLSKSGQTKSEAIASLSRLVQQQTRMISDEISNNFSDSYQIFEELDLLRERQDRVEEFLENDLRKRDAELSRSSSRGSTSTPRQVSSRLQQREIDQDLADRYMEKSRVRSTDLFNVMPTIYEDKIFHLKLKEIQAEEESDFPEYDNVDADFSDDGDNVGENETADGSEEVYPMKRAGTEDEENCESKQDQQDVGKLEGSRNVN